LRFFFTVTLDRLELARRPPIVREPRRLPAVLSVEGVTLLFAAAPGQKYKAAFATAYGAGLRVSEVVTDNIFVERLWRSLKYEKSTSAPLRRSPRPKPE
jgi:site-specific recombinase XerD